ncbi:MAG: hypothetical protein RIS35_1664 [Pseudomonadota bacterium]
MMRTELLDPKNDYVFKRLLADSPTLLASLINAVRHDRPPVEVVRVLNPSIQATELQGKDIVLDILAQDAFGRRFNVEMQAHKHPDWSERALFYLARTLGDQLRSGQAYEHLHGAVGVHILDFDLFNDPDQANWRFELWDSRGRTRRYSEKLELNFLELPRAMALGGQPKAISAWVDFFERWNEDAVMERIDEASVREARQRLEVISGDEEERIRAELREKALRDAVSWREWALKEAARGRQQGLAEGREQGLEQGLERGLERGRAEGHHRGEIAILERQLTSRFGSLPAAAIERLRRADETDLGRWAERIFDARSLDEFLDGC